jgi:hypothetical protein
METELMESRLTRVASFLESHQEPASVQQAVAELRSFENELVARRFVRGISADGRTVRMKAPGVEAALIHVSRALALIGNTEPHLEQAIASLENARTAVAHIAAV